MSRPGWSPTSHDEDGNPRMIATTLKWALRRAR
jgi:hypothetical protein